MGLRSLVELRKKEFFSFFHKISFPWYIFRCKIYPHGSFPILIFAAYFNFSFSIAQKVSEINLTCDQVPPPRPHSQMFLTKKCQFGFWLAEKRCTANSSFVICCDWYFNETSLWVSEEQVDCVRRRFSGGDWRSFTSDGSDGVNETKTFVIVVISPLGYIRKLCMWIHNELAKMSSRIHSLDRKMFN